MELVSYTEYTFPVLSYILVLGTVTSFLQSSFDCHYLHVILLISCIHIDPTTFIMFIVSLLFPEAYVLLFHNGGFSNQHIYIFHIYFVVHVSSLAVFEDVKM
jgi:hypothetical protein